MNKLMGKKLTEDGNTDDLVRPNRHLTTFVHI